MKLFYASRSSVDSPVSTSSTRTSKFPEPSNPSALTKKKLVIIVATISYNHKHQSNHNSNMSLATAYTRTASYYHWMVAVPLLGSVGSVLKAQGKKIHWCLLQFRFHFIIMLSQPWIHTTILKLIRYSKGREGRKGKMDVETQEFGCFDWYCCCTTYWIPPF